MKRKKAKPTDNTKYVEKYETKKVECKRCGKTFNADVDKMGVPYQSKCKKCKHVIKGNPDYYNQGDWMPTNSGQNR